MKTKMEIPRGEGTEDAVSDLAERVNAGEISVKEAAQLGTGLLIAGHETTANMIGLGVLALLENPDQAAVLRDTDDADVVANAVEELLRYDSPVNLATLRCATDAIDIAGLTIPAGQFVLVSLLSANRDETEFADPDELDIARPAGGQLAFGYGIHYCVAAPLARLEGEIALGRLLARFGTIRLAAEPGELTWRSSTLMHGLTTLPVVLA